MTQMLELSNGEFQINVLDKLKTVVVKMDNMHEQMGKFQQIDG